MIGNKRLLAIIPARGGSKRLPRKNVLDLAGKPLISWSIDTARHSKYIDRTIVSTDDNEIAAISRKFGADVPFIRPHILACDDAKSIDVVIHTIEYLSGIDDVYDFIILLQPTSPLRSAEDIDRALEQLVDKDHDGVISVCKCEHSPLWCNTLDRDLSMIDFLSDDILNKRSQDLPTYYRLNGAIFIASIPILIAMDDPSFFIKNTISAYIMPVERSIDIDNKIDFDVAEVLVNQNINEKYE
jgi:CMP-N,N'-diacetyllegionaminic acid synthase